MKHSSTTKNGSVPIGYSKFAADTAPSPRRAALYRHRAQLFAQQFVYWFDANGAGYRGL